MKVEQQAIRDLLKVFYRFSDVDYARNMLLAFRETEKYFTRIETDQEEATAIEMAIKTFFEKFLHLYPKCREESIQSDLMIHYEKLTTELQNYLPEKRAEMIDAALEELAGPVEKTHKLNAMISEIKQAFNNLDARTKAILKLLNEFTLTNDMGLDECVYDELFNSFRSGNIEAIRNDKHLATLVQAYDLIMEYKEAVEY